VVAGMVGSFGGMSLAAALCSYLVVTPQARIGMNGPEVIEQEAGIEELNASDKTHIWSLIGGAQRYRVGMVDALLEDDAQAIAAEVRQCFVRGVPSCHRTEDVANYSRRLAEIDTSAQLTGAQLSALWGTGESK
jgi:malonate decarboxylase beta subunit